MSAGEIDVGALMRSFLDVQAERDQLQATFEMTWAADMRAIKRWQQAHPGMELVWPDRTALVGWLLEQLEGAKPLVEVIRQPVEAFMRDGQYMGQAWTIYLLSTDRHGQAVSARTQLTFVAADELRGGQTSAMQYELGRMRLAIDEKLKEA